MSVTTSSNPISSVPVPNLITSVPEPTYPPSYSNQNQNNNQLLTRLHLDLRGTRFVVERETLMNLPESVLLCLFPNGLVLSRQGQWGMDGMEDEEEEVYGVDYDPQCFTYVLQFWSTAQSQFYGPPSNSPSSPSLYSLQQSLLSGINSGGPQQLDQMSSSDNPLITKQPIIVLREELEYFSIPPPSTTNPRTPGIAPPKHPLSGAQTLHTLNPTPISAGPGAAQGAPSEALQRLKRECGKALLARGKVFTALQRNVSKEGNLAEQHLIDMLCMSGFSREDTWGYRALEPTRCCISSIALVLLKTGINHGSASAGGNGKGGSTAAEVTVDSQQMATAQKLLLFWRKPARKCWWDGVEVEIPITDSDKKTAPVKVWARRVWTLELSLI